MSDESQDGQQDGQVDQPSEEVDGELLVEEPMQENRSGDEADRRRLKEIWVSGTEEPPWVTAATDEGAQEMLPRDQELQVELDAQAGVTVLDDRLYEEDFVEDETNIINMGPQHPSTHGVLRLQLELEGEIVRRAKPVIGYLHTGMEKTAETLTYLQGGTNVTRMDYLAPLHNELVFLACYRAFAGNRNPDRGQAIRILMTELNRISQPSGLGGDPGHGHRRSVDDDLRPTRARADPRLLRKGHWSAHEPQLHQARRRRRRPP